MGGFQLFGGRSGGDGCCHTLPFNISIIGHCTGTTPPPPISLEKLCLVNVDIVLLLPILNGKTKTLKGGNSVHWYILILMGLE